MTSKVNQTSQNTDTEVQTSNGKRRRTLLIVTVVLSIIFVGAGLWWYFIASQREHTEDAYVGGTQVSLTSQIPGTVISVMVEENQTVVAGQVVAKLDITDAQNALDKASSALALSVRQYHQLQAQADQFDAVLVMRKLELSRAKEDLKRREPLQVNEAIAGEELRHARDAVTQAEAALKQSEQQSKAAHAMVDGSTVHTNPAVQQAKQAYIDAWIHLQRTTVKAPIAGHVAQKNLQPGQHIQPGQPLLTIIPMNTVWVDANFKESQLRNLRIGQSAIVKSDLYGNDVTYHGTVTGISAGTGAAFALLPPQNAAGNWIKVIQRVPVRIALKASEVEQHPLRVGLSMQVEVDTHDRSGAVIPLTAQNNFKAETTIYDLDVAQAVTQAEALIARQP